jgi:hypothetical protein
MPDDHPPPDPPGESPSVAELAWRAIHLRHEADRLIAETREAIREARATAERCRENGPVTRPDPH